MGKKMKCFLFVILPVFLYSCATVYKGDDFTIPKEEILPPGEVYTPEREKCLNVVYYVPSDTVAWAKWHYRLSGITLHIQEYFEENLKRHHVNNNFGLVVNENPEYVKIHFIQSTRKCIDMGQKDIEAMKSEVLAYFNQHPGERLSDNFLVFMPKYEKKSFACYTAAAEDGVGMAFCSCDDDRFDMKFFNSPRGRALYLTEMGEILYNLSRSFFCPLEDHGTFDGYLHLMGSQIINLTSTTLAMRYNYSSYSSTYTANTSFTAGVPDKIRLSASSANVLGSLPLIRNEEGRDPLNVEIVKTEIASFKGDYTGVNFSADSLFVTCRFKADMPITGMIMYHDPWLAKDLTATPYKDKPEWDEDPLNDTGYDAYATWLSVYDMDPDPETGGYIARFRISMDDLQNKHIKGNAVTNNSEIRFRFIGEDGGMYPRYPDIKGGENIMERTLDANGQEIPGIQYGVRYIYQVTGRESAGSISQPKTIAHDIQTRYGSRVPVEKD